ncbi:hypothetical protein EV182_007702, partial [Spiromyces aspiralis]
SLKGDWPIDRIKNRNFSSGRISPFAANLALELYKDETLATAHSSSNGDTHPLAPYFVRVLVNEAPVVVSGCGPSQSTYCPWETFSSLFDHVRNCSLAERCQQ